MARNDDGEPNRYLRTSEAGRFLSLSGRTLEKHRIYGTGPAYHKVGGRVVYSISDLQAWVDKAVMRSTSDPQMVRPARRIEPANNRDCSSAG